MCKVGGPRCSGSHTPSARQRAKRKANKAYRRALADTIEEKTGDAELAKRVRQANMTDLHEVAMLAGVNEAAIAERCGTATYTGNDGETVTVDVQAPGQTRRTAANDESKQLFAEVYAATAKRGPHDDGTELERALLAGDRERVDEINGEVEEINDWVYQTYSDRDAVRGMTDEELVALNEESNQRLRDAARLAGGGALGNNERSDLGRAESELAERGLRSDGTKFGFDPNTTVRVLEKKDDESDEYTTARRMAERFNDADWAATDVDNIRNQAMFAELADRATDPDARAAYLEMAERMEKSAAINRSKYRFSDDEFNTITAAGFVRAGINEGRSDKALSDMYDELAGLRHNNESPLESAMLDEARRELALELDSRGVDYGHHMHDEMEQVRKQYDGNPEELSDAELRDVMERMTQERAEAYSRSDSPQVRAEADALAGPIANEYAKRVAVMDDLSNVPAYMWPEDTEGKTLPDTDELRENAEFFYGLRGASKAETAGLADTSEYSSPILAGIDPTGTAVYRDSGALYHLAQPSRDEMPNDDHRRAYNSMRLAEAKSSGQGHDVNISDTTDAAVFAQAAEAFDNLDTANNGRLGGAPLEAANATKFLKEHPVSDDQKFTDDDMHVLADRARAASLAEQNASLVGDGAVGDAARDYGEYKATQERKRLAKALDDQLRRGGTYAGFVDEHGMTYEKAFAILEDHNNAVHGNTTNVAGRTQRIKDELAAAAREGREPKYRNIAKELKAPANTDADLAKARELASNVELRFGTEDYAYGDGRIFAPKTRTRASWSKSGTSGSLDDVVNRDNPLAPTDGVTFTSKADADIAAAYVRHQASPAIVKAISRDVDMVRADNTYAEVRVPKGRVSDEARNRMLASVESGALDSYEYGDGAMRGITRNAAGVYDAATAAKNYPVIYSHVMSHIGSEHEYEMEHAAALGDSERADYDELARTRSAYVTRLSELYDRAEAGDNDAALELVDTAAVAFDDDESFLRTRQYVDPDQGSLF